MWLITPLTRTMIGSPSYFLELTQRQRLSEYMIFLRDIFHLHILKPTGIKPASSPKASKPERCYQHLFGWMVPRRHWTSFEAIYSGWLSRNFPIEPSLTTTSFTLFSAPNSPDGSSSKSPSDFSVRALRRSGTSSKTWSAWAIGMLRDYSRRLRLVRPLDDSGSFFLEFWPEPEYPASPYLRGLPGPSVESHYQQNPLLAAVIRTEVSPPSRYPTSSSPFFRCRPVTKKASMSSLAYLSPLWVEQLLGLPPLWTDATHDTYRKNAVHLLQHRYRHRFPTLSIPYIGGSFHAPQKKRPNNFARLNALRRYRVQK